MKNKVVYFAATSKTKSMFGLKCDINETFKIFLKGSVLFVFSENLILLKVTHYSKNAFTAYRLYVCKIQMFNVLNNLQIYKILLNVGVGLRTNRFCLLILQINVISIIPTQFPHLKYLSLWYCYFLHCFIGPEEICSFVIGDACGDMYNPYHDWEVAFPPVPKPPVIPASVPKVCRIHSQLYNIQLHKIYSVDFQPSAPTFKVLHISDTHYDPYYLEGSNADCAEPLCCRLTNGPAASKEQAAGKYVTFTNSKNHLLCGYIYTIIFIMCEICLYIDRYSGKGRKDIIISVKFRKNTF